MYSSPYTAPFMASGMGGYAPPASPYQGVPQFPQNPAQPSQLVQQSDQRRTNAEWIPVSSVQQVREHIVQPNQTLYFMNNNKAEFYVKTSDSFGTPTFKAFRFEEINPDVQPVNVAPVADRTVLDGMEQRIRALEERFTAMTTGGAKKNEPDYANDERKPD